MNNHYETLEIEINADQLQIKKAYRSLANRFHPDKNGNQEFFKNKFIEIKNAYDILIDPVSKLYYDTELRSYLNKINEDAEEKKQNSNSKFDENNSFFFKEPFLSFYEFRESSIRAKKLSFLSSLNTWEDVLIVCKQIRNNLKNKNANKYLTFYLTYRVCYKKINSVVNILDEQRQVFLALILRDISILIWNSYGNLELSYKLIKKATRINVSNEVKALIHNELNKFIEIKNYREINGTPMRKAPRLFTYYGCGVDMKYQTKCFVLFSAPILPLAKYNCEETQSGYIFYGKLKLDPLERLWKISFISIALLFFIISRLNYNN